MFKGKEEVVILAVLVIVISATLSGFGVYFFLNQRAAKNVAEEIILNKDGLDQDSLVSTGSPSDLDNIPENEIVEEASLGGDTQKAAQTLGDFYTYLESGEYDRAAALVDWQYVNEDLLSDIYGIGLGVEDRAGILAEICSREEAKTKIRILSAREPVSGENSFSFRVNYLEEDGQVYVNSSHVAGQFINETEFVIEVVKKGEGFLVRTLPGMFVLE